jgi:DNA-binding transcriptional LysR family regulator
MNRVAAEWQWDDIRFFIAVSRAGSLSGAARVLGVGHVTVGRRVALLERRLGVKLLNRTPEGFSITPPGHAILGLCAVMESAALDVERIAAGRDALAAGTVRLTTTEALAHRVIAPAIAALRRTYPPCKWT